MESNSNQGALGPLLGDMSGSTTHVDHSFDDTPAKKFPSKAWVGSLEESGRAATNVGRRKRAKWALGTVAQGPREGMEEQAKMKTKDKRQERDSHRGKVRDIRHLFETKGGPQSPSLSKETKKQLVRKVANYSPEAGSLGTRAG